MLKAQPHMTMRERAGRYVRQPSGYRAFLPAPLPPDPPVRVDGELQRLLSQADMALGRLDGTIQTLPNPNLWEAPMGWLACILNSRRWRWRARGGCAPIGAHHQLLGRHLAANIPGRRR